MKMKGFALNYFCWYTDLKIMKAFLMKDMVCEREGESYISFSQCAGSIKNWYDIWVYYIALLYFSIVDFTQLSSTEPPLH